MNFNLYKKLFKNLFHKVFYLEEGIKFFKTKIFQKIGNAEWEGKDKQRCLIIWRTPDQWGDLIYKWIFDRGMTDTVFTVYELLNGDDTTDAGLNNYDFYFQHFFLTFFHFLSFFSSSSILLIH